MLIFGGLYLLSSTAWAEQLSQPFESGFKAYRAKDYVTAQKEFNRAVEKNPEDALSHYYLGLTYNHRNKYRAAAAVLEKALQLDPELPGINLSLGIAYYKGKSYEPAHQHLQLALRKEPSEPSIHFFLGLALQGMNQFRQSIEPLKKAAQLDPALRQSCWYHIGVAHYRLQKPGLARKALKHAITLDPRSDNAREARRVLKQIRLGRPPKETVSFYAGLGFLYDDNLTSKAQDLVSEEGDLAAVLEGGGRYQFLKRGPYTAEASYDFYQSLYFDLDEFNLLSHNLGLSGTREVDQWDLDASYTLGYNLLGGSDFLSTNSFSFGMGLPIKDRWYTRGAYTLMFKNFHQHINDPRDGIYHRIGLDQFVFLEDKNSYGQLGFYLIHENTSGALFDYSGFDLLLSGQTPTLFQGKLTGRYQYLLKNFSDITPSIGEERLDQRHVFQITWTRPWEDLIEFKLDFQHIESISNLPAVDYSENIFFLGGMFKFN